MTRGRLRLLLAAALTLALVGPLGWLWWASLLPASYSAMEMGEPDHGGGPVGRAHAAGHGTGATSLVELAPTPTGPADVRIDLVARQGTVRLASGEEVDGYTLNGRSPGPLVEATVGQLVEVRLRPVVPNPNRVWSVCCVLLSVRACYCPMLALSSSPSRISPATASPPLATASGWPPNDEIRSIRSRSMPATWSCTTSTA